MGFLLINKSKIDLLSRVTRRIFFKNHTFTRKKKRMKSASTKNNKKNNFSNPVEITADGSLGLLALGAVGIKEWKKKREEQQSKLKKD